MTMALAPSLRLKYVLSSPRRHVHKTWASAGPAGLRGLAGADVKLDLREFKGRAMGVKLS